MLIYSKPLQSMNGISFKSCKARLSIKLYVHVNRLVLGVCSLKASGRPVCVNTGHLGIR